MLTALLLTNPVGYENPFREVIAEYANVVAPPLAGEGSRELFDELFNKWLPLVDAVVVDAPALGETTVLAIQALTAASMQADQAVVVRATAMQREMFALPRHWLLISESDAPAQLRQSLVNFLELRATQAKLKQVNELINRQRPAGQEINGLTASANQVQAVSAYEVFRHREAVKSISRFMSGCHNHQELLTECLRLLQELLGVGRLAIYMRDFQVDLLAREPVPTGNILTLAAGVGIPRAVGDHIRLSLNEGIGASLARDMKIVQRARVAETQAFHYDALVAREFELLGTEVAVPILDNDQLLGMLMFAGKITGNAVSSEELEFVYHLMGHLAQATRHLLLRDQMERQGRFVGEVLANVQSGVVAVGQDGRILNVNARASDLLEVSEGKLIGHRMSRLPGRVADLLFEVLDTGTEVRRKEILLPRSNRPLSVSATRFAASGTGAFVVVGMIEDLTQAKLQEAQAHELADREFFLRLASRMSHELRNSLVAIKIYAQLLPERYGQKDFRDQFSSTVITEVNRVDVLVSNLTFFAHALELVHEPLDLAELIDACLQRTAQECARKQQAQIVLVGEKQPSDSSAGPVVTVKRIYGHKSPKLEGDRIRLTQAFEHLIRNAIQAMPTGGRLTISTADGGSGTAGNRDLPEGGTVRVEWQDVGEGIPLEHLKHVTEPFFTTRTIGVGLGLTIVKKIVERHGGWLDIDSILGRGTTVAIELPLKAQPHPEDQVVAEAVPQVSQAGGLEDGEATEATDRLAPARKSKRVTKPKN